MGSTAPSRDVPVVLAGRDGNRRVVTASDAAAHRAGLRVGMAAAAAQALVVGLELHEADPDGDVEELTRLAAWALRYSPVVAIDPPNGLVLDTTGADHLHGGEDEMLHDLVRRLIERGIAARAAVADTWGAAHALARYGATPVHAVPPSGHRKALVPLPIAALRLPTGVVDELRVLGFETIGEIAAQPRAPLLLRFGMELGRRLDQAMGDAHEPIDPVRPPELAEAERVFAEPIGAPETIARYVGKLTVALCALMEARHIGARRLDLLFHRVDNRIEAIRIGTVRPSRDAARLTKLLAEKIETVDPGFGIERMRIAATWAEPLAPRQESVRMGGEPIEADLSGLIDTLANRVGADAVYEVRPVPSDVPERSLAHVPPLSPGDDTCWPFEWPRPARLLPRPEPIDTLALLPDHPPVHFTWRGVRRKVRRADGPERIFGEWWKREAERAAVRDYFRVEDESGERFWIFRAGDGEDQATGSHRWFLHGVFG